MTFLHWIVLICYLLTAPAAAWHALLYKRDPRAAWGWLSVCLFFPLCGALFYVLFGVNRVRTQASKLGKRAPFDLDQQHPPPQDPAVVARVSQEYAILARTTSAITGHPLLGGNHLVPLWNGEEAYPAMLEAIEQARNRVYLATYIFEGNEIGRQFAKALGRAVKRGADVRVLLDGIGELSAWPPGGRTLERHGVPLARFLPPKLVPPSLFLTLRCHHKILVADAVGFTGGMNIGDRYLVRNKNPERVQDLHFRLCGPILAQMEEVFLWDWGFATGRETEPPSTMPGPCGEMVCRAVSDGPNEDFDKLPAVLLAAVNSAREHISVMSPYFLPPRELIGALQSAAQRGVRVEVLLPEKSDHPIVDHATRNMLWELLVHGVDVRFQPPPFAHTKLFLVDGYYALIGSANLDPRSLRLNFELVVEVYDGGFTGGLLERFAGTFSVSRRTCLAEVDGRKLLPRTRDALCWLFSPYL